MLSVIIFGFIWSQIISHFAVSIGLHRYFAHSQIKVGKSVESIMLFMIMIACVRTPIGWIASHRMHHTYSDTKLDPHSMKFKGFWKVFLTTWSLDRIPIRFAKDLYANTQLVWCHKNWKKFLLVSWIISLLIGIKFFIAFSLIPFIMARLGFGLLNTVGHLQDGGVNVPWLNLIIAGEGFHKNHHEDTTRIRLHKYDFGGYLAERLFEKNKEATPR